MAFFNPPAWLRNTPICHRGAHDQNVIENSMRSFEIAQGYRYGVEFDVTLGLDDVLVVHDLDLNRLCGKDILTQEIGNVEREKYRLRDGQKIPTLVEVLEALPLSMPLICEIKAQPTTLAGQELVSRVVRLLKRRKISGGQSAVHSFEPKLLRLLALHGLELCRGQVAGSEEAKRIEKVFRDNYISAPITQPSFIAHNIKLLPNRRVANMRNWDIPVLAWTVECEEELEKARLYADNVLVEGEGLEALLDLGGDFSRLRKVPKKLKPFRKRPSLQK